MKQLYSIKLIQLLSVIGIVIAFYLHLFHGGHLKQVACEIGSIWDCASVSGPDAPYSSMFGIPVATIGLIGYITLFLLSWASDMIPIVRQYIVPILRLLLVVSILFTAYLTYLEAVVLEAWCEYCVYSAVNILIMTIIIFLTKREVSS